MTTALLTGAAAAAEPNPVIATFQEWVAQVPEAVQPLIVALAAAIPYIEGEGAAGIGIIGGIHPVVAGIAGVIGNFLCVLVVVLVTSRTRTAITDRAARKRAAAASADGTQTAAAVDEAEPEPTSKGRRRLKAALVRFGVPGASLLGPLALPTQLTAATLVASGVNKAWVLLWQAVAIVLWTTLIVLLITGLLGFLA